MLLPRFLSSMMRRNSVIGMEIYDRPFNNSAAKINTEVLLRRCSCRIALQVCLRLGGHWAAGHH